MDINLYEISFSEAFFSDFRQLTAIIFEDSADKDWLDSLQWRLESMPNTTVFMAEDSSKLIGYQVGYATAYNRYYNWLNGVIPEYRRRGIGKELMQHQYEWLQRSRYKSL
jgi:ribosomal protein S18 acetylase RimI-like enzyme